MQFLSFYKTNLNCRDSKDVFDFLISNLKPSNMVWSYFVNWEKVLGNTCEIESALNKLNGLNGKHDFDKEFKSVLKQDPSIAKVIPALLVRGGSKEEKFKILVNFSKKKLVYEDYDFSKKAISDADIEKYLHFVKETGLKHLITGNKIKNLLDYMIGVEAGLDSHGRKNRGGRVMEDIVGTFIKDVCQKNNFKWRKEVNEKKIKKELGYDVPVDKSSRRYDFVIDNGKELFIIETNFYGRSGSKLKSTAGEYKNLFDVLKGKYKFLWITDGMGWKKTDNSLCEAFKHNDYLFNLKMLEEGILDAVLTS